MTPKEKLDELVRAYYQAEEVMVQYALENDLPLYIEGKGEPPARRHQW